MDRSIPRLNTADLGALRAAVRRAQGGLASLPRREVLDVHAAAPNDINLTIDFEATAELGMPLLVVRVPIGPRPSPVLGLLTPREFEVAGLVAAGFANKEIAARLGIRTSTVKDHVHRILAKTGMPSRAAVAHAYSGADAVAQAARDHGPEARGR